MNATPTTFHERLRAVIEGSGRSQREIADAAGAHPNQVSSWTTGRWTPSSRHLANLAKALDIDLNWLLLGHGHVPSTPEGEDELARRLTELAPQLSEVVELAREKLK